MRPTQKGKGLPSSSSSSFPSAVFVQRAVSDFVLSLLHLFVRMSACRILKALQTNQSADALISKSEIWDASLLPRLIFCVNLAPWVERFLHPSRVRLAESPSKAFWTGEAKLSATRSHFQANSIKLVHLSWLPVPLVLGGITSCKQASSVFRGLV